MEARGWRTRRVSSGGQLAAAPAAVRHRCAVAALANPPDPSYPHLIRLLLFPPPFSLDARAAHFGERARARCGAAAGRASAHPRPGGGAAPRAPASLLFTL